MTRARKLTDSQVRPVFIYGLVDPLTDEIRYIGKTVRPKERLQNHMNEKSNCHRSHWLQSLKAQGLRPSMVLIEEVCGAWPWQESERHWIAYGRRHGWPLTNNTSGGDGVPDLPIETRRKMASTWLGRKHSDETKAKIGASSSFRCASELTRKKMSNAHSGREITWAEKIGEANRKFDAEAVLVIRDRLASGEKVVSLALEYGVHRGTITKIKKGIYMQSHKNISDAKREQAGLFGDAA